MAPPDSARRARIAARLLDWYRAEARDLPWRRTRDPYAIWISEAMLQQTRVETVIGYWRRFLDRLPTVEALAEAEEDEVLALWSGLGYYRRARALHAAARTIVAEHGGRFPADPDAAAALPGVGPYTVGAVLSIAYDAPRALVDGNVERVFGRLFAIDAAAASSELKRAAWDLAERFVPRAGGAGEWNQALMELGAVVCTPRAPRCLLCPLNRSCAARRDGDPEAFPRPRSKPATIDVALEILVVESGEGWLLERRPEGGRMSRMWQFPTREVPFEGAPPRGLFPSDWPVGARLDVADALFELRHGITRHRIRANVRRGGAREVPEGWGWFRADDMDALALTGMARKVRAKLRAATLPPPLP